MTREASLEGMGETLFFLLAGLSTGEVLADGTGDLRFLLALEEATVGVVTFLVFLLLGSCFFFVPLGGAGEEGPFIEHTFKMHAFFSLLRPPYLTLSLQCLHTWQSAEVQSDQWPHLPPLLNGLGAGAGFLIGSVTTSVTTSSSGGWSLSACSS